MFKFIEVKHMILICRVIPLKGPDSQVGNQSSITSSAFLAVALRKKRCQALIITDNTSQ